ncbi:hypothetical protein QE152_g7670 [Popillia japonica]|uniref:Uncharacterized protein n=1 Tax=Popillia japonica TaxID=7064 RepID=A0AAW1MCL4_POPJA
MQSAKALRAMAATAMEIEVNDILDSVLPLEEVNLERIVIITPFGEAPPIPEEFDVIEESNLLLYLKVQEAEEDEEDDYVVVWAYRKW